MYEEISCARVRNPRNIILNNAEITCKKRECVYNCVRDGFIEVLSNMRFSDVSSIYQVLYNIRKINYVPPPGDAF